MGQISTPPMPAARYCSSSAVKLGASTALPSHHQRVQGLLWIVAAGQASGSVGLEEDAQDAPRRGKPAADARRVAKSIRDTRVFMGCSWLGRRNLRGQRVAHELEQLN